MASRETLRERLSNLAHVTWAGWMKHLFKKSEKNADGTVTIPKWAVDRWEHQIETAYEDLTKEEKDSDRAEADKVIAEIEREK